MKTKSLTCLLSLTFLFLFSCSEEKPKSEPKDDFQNAQDAYDRQDYETAYKLLTPLGEQGHAFAQFNLGTLYSEGKGVPQDHKEAVKWFRLAADQGDTFSQYNLGMSYAKGHGVLQDSKEAVKWYRLAAEQGLAEAQYIMGLMHDKGKGVPQDYVLAHMWWNIAGSNGDKNAVTSKNTVEKDMTPQQIEKAKEMARNWKQKK